MPGGSPELGKGNSGWVPLGKIHPTSSKGHSFIIVATDYFTKWVEAVPLKKAKYKDVIQFIKEQIIHRFRIPQFIPTNQRTMFTRKEMNYFTTDYGIQLIISTHFYAQEKAFNKVLMTYGENSRGESQRLTHNFIRNILGI